MLKIKMYDCADAAVEDAKAWFKDKFIHGYFNLLSPGDASSGHTRDILGWINVKFLELDQLQGSLICETNPTTCVYPNAQNKELKRFKFLEPMTEDEIKYLPEPEPENIILSECEVHANEGLVVFYDENPKEDGLIILAVKMSMYKKMKERLDEAVQPGSMAFIHGYDFVYPAAIVFDARESVIEELLENLEYCCNFAENTIEEIKALGNDVLLQLENDWYHDEIDGGTWENLRDHADRFLANHGEDE